MRSGTATRITSTGRSVICSPCMAKSTTTNTLKDDVYAFIFGQKGLMAGLGLQGNKIKKITPK